MYIKTLFRSSVDKLSLSNNYIMLNIGTGIFFRLYSKIDFELIIIAKLHNSMVPLRYIIYHLI